MHWNTGGVKTKLVSVDSSPSWPVILYQTQLYSNGLVQQCSLQNWNLGNVPSEDLAVTRVQERFHKHTQCYQNALRHNSCYWSSPSLPWRSVSKQQMENSWDEKNMLFMHSRQLLQGKYTCHLLCSGIMGIQKKSTDRHEKVWQEKELQPPWRKDPHSFLYMLHLTSEK